MKLFKNTTVFGKVRSLKYNFKVLKVIFITIIRKKLVANFIDNFWQIIMEISDRKSWQICLWSVLITHIYIDKERSEDIHAEIDSRRKNLNLWRGRFWFWNALCTSTPFSNFRNALGTSTPLLQFDWSSRVNFEFNNIFSNRCSRITFLCSVCSSQNDKFRVKFHFRVNK